MEPRIDLQRILENIMLASFPDIFPDSKAPNKYHVYFQAPENVRISYPAIIYKRSDEYKIHSNNTPYYREVVYTVTYIDRDPDSLVSNRISMLPKCGFDRAFIADGLNHDVFNITF